MQQEGEVKVVRRGWKRDVKKQKKRKGAVFDLSPLYAKRLQHLFSLWWSGWMGVSDRFVRVGGGWMWIRGSPPCPIQAWLRACVADWLLIVCPYTRPSPHAEAGSFQGCRPNEIICRCVGLSRHPTPIHNPTNIPSSPAVLNALR